MSAQVSPASRRLRRPDESARVSDRLALVPHRSAPAGRAPFVALIITLLGLGVFGLLMFNTQMQQRAFLINSLQIRANGLNDQVQGLRLKQQQFEDPQHLAVAARALGMVVSPNPAFISLAGKPVMGVPVISTMNDALEIRQKAAPKPGYLVRPPKIVRVPASTQTTPNTTANTTTKGTSPKKSTTSGAASTGRHPGRGTNSGTTPHR